MDDIQRLIRTAQCETDEAKRLAMVACLCFGIYVVCEIGVAILMIIRWLGGA